ncbi:MAG: hypothetical protein JWQ33_2298 [Ramlibacter sp.]|nr:hypothetical protein [Ramlibacter sp.]
MNDTQPEAGNTPWSRPRPTRSGPRRNAGGLYRTAEGADGASGGVPLNTANAAVVAAVRLAYRVAEAQIDRSTRLAQRLRDAGDQEAGPHSDQKALDAAEKLVLKTMMSGLEWWEGSVAEGRCPVKRLAAAEYQMLGSILGLGPAKHAKKPPTDDAAAATSSAAWAADANGIGRKPATAMRRLQVVHKGERKDRRPVRIEAWEITLAGALQTVVYFFNADHGENEPIEAELEVSADNADIRLMIATPPRATPGRWKCAVCDSADVQVGSIEISL